MAQEAGLSSVVIAGIGTHAMPEALALAGTAATMAVILSGLGLLPGGVSSAITNVINNGGNLGNTISSLLGNAQQQVIDPLVVSTNGQVVTTTSLANGAYVDYQGTGFAGGITWY